MQIAADAIVAARASHAFMGMTKMGMAAIFETRGNDDCHVILRGGKKGPNYDGAPTSPRAAPRCKAAGLREQVMIDCSHAQLAASQHLRQIDVGARRRRSRSPAASARIIGVMIESHLEEGRQDLKPGVPLRAACRSPMPASAGPQTEPVLEALAQAVRERRAG